MSERGDLSYLPTLRPPLPLAGHAFFYILACSDGALYIGSATDLAVRLGNHGGPKGAKSTRDHSGGRLVYLEGPLPIGIALQRD
jgi:putative endonuclease